MDRTGFVLLKDVQAVLDWIESFICKPHPDLGRKGAICHFVKPSLDKGKLLIDFSYDIDGSDIGEVEQRTYQYMDRFLQLLVSDEQDRVNKSLVMVFPNIPRERCEVIDAVHARVKTKFVKTGLMLGQFHQTCPEPAVRNRAFEVSRSPLPAFALRYMAVHDILFLYQKKIWFDEYCLRFGRKYELGQISNKDGFVDLFNQTKERFSSLAPDLQEIK